MSDYIWELGLRIGILRVEYSISIFLIDQLFNMIKEIYLPIDIKILFLINIGIFFVKKLDEIHFTLLPVFLSSFFI